jgi:hypothetical protein
MDLQEILALYDKQQPHSQFASLHGGATLPDYRGQGLYASLLAVRGQEAIQRGYRFSTIEAGPMKPPHRRQA